MSRVDELIKEKCSSGVDYRTLGQLEDSGIITLGRGKVISKKDIQDNPGEYPIYSSSAVGSGIFGTYGNYMFDDVRLSWSIDGGGKFFYRDAPRYSVTNVCGWLTVDKPEVLDIRYLYFALTNEWSKKVFDYVHKAHPSVIRKEYTIPVPPLEVQQEIVRMLDSFTELEAELEAELTKRKQQYAFYRDNILEKYNAELYVQLDDLCEKTTNIKWKETQEQFKYIDLSSVNRETGEISDTILISSDNAPSRAQQVVRTNDIVFATTRPTLMRYAIIPDNYNGQICSTGYCVLRANNRVLPKWIYYNISSSRFKKYCEENQEGTSYPGITNGKVKQFRIPIPSLEEQERTITVLENFNMLTKDISIGLPAEIEARHKQYEYYRDKLLTFEERVAK